MIKISPFLSIILCVLLMLYPKAAFAVDNEFITSVDVMKYTKDTVQNQFTDAQIDAVVSLIMKEIKPRYISISVPLDEDLDFPAESKPMPRRVQDFAQKWADSIHKHGAKVIFRGTFSGIEGIYNFPKLAGDKIFPAGTVASAATDGRSSWLGKIYNYITLHPGLFGTGDIWAILPERTEGIFQAQTSFLNYGPGIQTAYPKFFTDLNQVSKNAFDKIGKNVLTGYTANNFSELASGWMSKSLYTGQSMIAVDHYGINHTPVEMENDLRAVSKKYGKPIFLQEWGDYWNSNLPAKEREVYLNSMYGVFSKLAAEKILIGFNYWGGWANNLEGILTNNGGVFGINSRGLILAKFFANFTTASSPQPPPPNPVPTPPVPTSTPTPPVIVPPPVSPSAPLPAAPAATTPPPQSPQIRSSIIPGLDILPAIPPTAQAADGELLVQNQTLRVYRNLSIYVLFGIILTLFVWRKRKKIQK